MEGQLTVGRLLKLINILVAEEKIKLTDRVFIIGNDEELNGVHEPYSVYELCESGEEIDKELIENFNEGLINDVKIKENETILLIS